MLKQNFFYLAITFLVICFASTICLAANPLLYAKENVLAVGIYNNATSSSDLTLIVRADVGGKTIIDEGYEIAYTIPKSDIKGWTTIEFDASTWKKGVSGIGYDDGDDNTTVPSGIAGVYVRYYFDVPNVKDVREITFWVDYDDAYILWLNDVEVGRSDNVKNIAPKGVPNWNQVLGIVDHESTDTPAGKPNAARWAKAIGPGAGQIMQHAAGYDLGGDQQKNVGAKPTGAGGQTASGAPIFLKNNILAAVNFNDAASSSDMTLVLRLTGDGTIYVDEGNSVKYITDPDNADVPDTWIQTKFDDKAWKDGVSGVGFADNDDNTTTPASLISIFTRYKFDAPNADKIKELVLSADYDDAYIAWLNGVRISDAGIGAIAGDPPAWDASKVAGVTTNHEASILAAGKPNAARWSNGAILKTTVDFKYGGSSAQPVNSAGKLTSTWGKIKNQ
jgi:hypothetical protein